jgi:hypothetical protein
MHAFLFDQHLSSITSPASWLLAFFSLKTMLLWLIKALKKGIFPWITLTNMWPFSSVILQLGSFSNLVLRFVRPAKFRADSVRPLRPMDL